MTMGSCNDGDKKQSSIPKWLSETPSPVWSSCVQRPSAQFVAENDSNEAENIRELPYEHLQGFNMCKTETDRREFKLAHQAIAWLESDTSNKSSPETVCIDIDNLFKLFAWMYQDDGDLEHHGGGYCQTFKTTLNASGRVPLEKKLKTLTSSVKGKAEVEKLVFNICNVIRHSGSEDPTLFLLCFNNLARLVRDERFWQIALLTAQDDADACADRLITMLGKGIIETTDKNCQRITLVRALSTFSVRLGEFVRVMAPALSPATVRRASAAMAQSLGVFFQFCDNSTNTTTDHRVRVAAKSGAYRIIVAWISLLSQPPCGGDICTCGGPGHCSKQILLGLEPSGENGTGWGPAVLLRCLVVAQTEPHELSTQAGVLGLLPEDNDAILNKGGEHFQNKLVFSSSLASVQHFVIPWMLIHLTGVYHRLVGDTTEQLSKMKMGLLLVESFGSSLCGVLAQADTFSSALADALKGCIHSGAVCREAWVIGTVKFFRQLVNKGNRHQSSLFLRRFMGDALLHSSPKGDIGVLHYFLDDHRDVCTALCNAVERIMVHCVPHFHLSHAVWEPLAEYAELQRSEQSHTQPKLHPATVRLAWLCNSLFHNIDISSSLFAQNELLECAVRSVSSDPQDMTYHNPKVGDKRQFNGDCCHYQNRDELEKKNFSGFLAAAGAVDSALSIYKDSSTHLADRQWLTGSLVRVCLESRIGSLSVKALHLIFLCLDDGLQSLGDLDRIDLLNRMVSEAKAVREQEPPGNKLPLQHLLLFVRLVGKIGSICGYSSSNMLENGHRGAAHPSATFPKDLKGACASVLQEGLESDHWLVRKESMEGVAIMLRMVDVEFATLLTARVPPSCVADLKKKLVIQSSSSPLDYVACGEGSVSNAVEEVLQHYYPPPLHSSTSHQPVSVLHQPCETVVSAEAGTPLSVLIPKLVSLEAEQPSAVLTSKINLVARHS